MTAPKIAVFAVCSLLMLGACTATGTAPTTGPTTGRQGLEGRTFLSTAIDGRSLSAGTRVRISFQGAQLGAQAGCNSMSGPYAIAGDRLFVRQLATTDMGCAQALMDQDAWLAGLLDGATIALDGDTLTLAKAGVTLTLLDREVADPDRPLIGTRWVVDGLVSEATVSSVPAGVTAALTFSAGRVDVEAGCNRGWGAVTIAEGSITVGSIGLSTMACRGDAMAVEQAVMAVLSGEVRHSTAAGSLTLEARGSGLTLHALP